MTHLATEMKAVAKEKLPKVQADAVAVALTQDKTAPFNVSSLHAFVHRADEFPGDSDIRTFWNRIAPLFELMLSRDVDE